jgi:KDO2-lipid IV(A) lauroyltransferase
VNDARARGLDVERLRAAFDDLRRHDSLFWRRAINAGVTYGPDAFVRYSPSVFGLAFWATLAEKREGVRKNLRLALGPRPVWREELDIAKTFTTFAHCMTEAFINGSRRGEKIFAHCPTDDRFRDAEDDGKGVIVATAHTGGWQSAHTVLRRAHQTDIIVVMGHERDQRAEALSDGVRETEGIRFMHLGDDPLAALALATHLTKRGIVALQIDRLPHGMRGRRGSLFGAPFSIPEGPLRLAALTGAPIVAVFSHRVRFMQYEVLIRGPIRVPRRPTGADLDAAAATILGHLERFVVEHPTQWFHFE